MSMKNIGSLREKTARNGEPYLSGTIMLPDGTAQPVVIFRNKFKWNSQDGKPDWIIYEPALEPDVEELTPHPF